MPRLDFLGKNEIANLHLVTPHRPLEVDKRFSIGGRSLSGNLIIQGDNLHALKALLVHYEGRVSCIYIDPPYNTGNEGWVYNDKVNSPLHKEWFGKQVGIEDQCRHDKWLCMMWPRLQLLKELLAEDGAIFISIDDNEQNHLRDIMNEIFGEDNFVAAFVWHHRKSSQNDIDISLSHNYILCYAKAAALFRLRPMDMPNESKFSNPDQDPRGPWRADPMDAPHIRENLTYPILNPNTKKEYWPPEGRCWRFSLEKYNQALKDKRIVFGKRGLTKPQYKRFLFESKGLNVFTIWSDVETATDAKKQINAIFGVKNKFETPKPLSLLKRIIKIASDKEAIILDSFAGSGTTAHAVLALNKEDGGTRKFILIECEEEIAPKITAERVRRVIKGVKGAKDENLRGGLGGNFTYCTLGDAIEEEKILSGESMPSWKTLARHVFYLATGETPKHTPKENKKGFVGKAGNMRIYLLYKDDLAFMRSNACVLNVDRAAALLKDRQHGESLIVYAAAAYLSHKELKRHHIHFCQLPYALETKGHPQESSHTPYAF